MSASALCPMRVWAFLCRATCVPWRLSCRWVPENISVGLKCSISFFFSFISSAYTQIIFFFLDGTCINLFSSCIFSATKHHILWQRVALASFLGFFSTWIPNSEKLVQLALDAERIMYSELVDIQPRELKFIFEVKKQSSCSVRLVNNTYHYVAFKVKTTSPKKYCVRPNTGVLKPNSTCDFTVTMQAQRTAPPDMVCKDKFLVQTTIVPAGTDDEDIATGMFSKDSGKYIEENKLRVILISPPSSPVLSPINGALKQVPTYEAPMPKDEVLNSVKTVTPHHMDEESEMIDEELKPVAILVDEKELKPVVQKVNTEELTPTIQKVADEEFKTAAPVSKMVNVMELKQAKDAEELTLVKDIAEMKSKLNQLEFKLSEAQVTISTLKEERRLTAQEREKLQQELAMLRSKRSGRRDQAGFPFLFVCMVALVSVMLGYLYHS